MTTLDQMSKSSWSTNVADFVAHMGAAGLSRGTIQIRVYHLTRIADELQGTPASLTVERLTAWLHSQCWEPNTRRAYRGTLRAFYSWSMAMGRVTISPAHQLPSVRVPRGRPRPISEDDYRLALLTSRTDPRAHLAIMLGGNLGLRRAEAAAARREDLERDLFGRSLRVKGKGGNVRLIPVPEDLSGEILRRPAGWLFPSPHGGHLTPHHLGKVVSSYLPDGHTMHSLRHRCGTATLEASGGNLRVVQEILGHANLNTTAIYTKVADRAMRAAVEAVA